MTIYYITADGRIVNNHDITRAYKKTDEIIPFPSFREAWLAGCGGRRAKVSVDDLIIARQIREAISFFNELTNCGIERAKNAVYTMLDAMRTADGIWLVKSGVCAPEVAA